MGSSFVTAGRGEFQLDTGLPWQPDPCFVNLTNKASSDGERT